MKGNKQYLLMILDGVGLNDEENGNAFKLAHTPNLDSYIIKYPNTYIATSGLAVGLPEGQMGNSEVGHTNIGAGRVIYQELTRISKEITDGDFFENTQLLKAIQSAKEKDKAIHLIGLLSDGGVHSHIQHLYALLTLCKQHGLSKVYIHAFLDGRDTSPTSGAGYLKDLEDKIKEIGVGKIVSIVGRYYAMDRDKRYERVQLAYRLLVMGEGNTFKSVQKGIENSYETEEFDEFVKPICISYEEAEVEDTRIKTGDSVIFFNFRPDRARQLSHVLTDTKFEEMERENLPVDLTYVTMTSYDEKLKNVLVAYKPQNISNTFGEYVSKLGYTQLRIAETEKYAHVTFFFNGGKEEELKGEERILIASPKVATYDLKPDMSAYEVTEKVIEAIDSKKHDVIIMNYANGDMVGHTGNLKKAIEAVEVLDDCLGKVMTKLKEVNGEAVITADHGNCEYMLDQKTGEAITSHSTFDVPLVVISDRVKQIRNGALCDIAPTMLTLMGLKTPNEMTGSSVIEV